MDEKKRGEKKEENERSGGGEKKGGKRKKTEGEGWVLGGRGAWVLRRAGPHSNNARST